MNLKELLERKGKLHADMTALNKKAHDENRFMSKEEQESWDRMNADYEETDKEIARRQLIDAREKSLAEPVNGGTPAAVRQPDQPQENSEERERKISAAFRNWVRGGVENLNPEQRSIMARRLVSFDGETRDYTPQTVTTTAGGYLIPQGFSNELEKSLKAFGGVRQVARVLSTPSGNTIPWPTVDDTSNVGELVAINTAAAGQAVTYGQVNIASYKFSSKAVLVPLELLQDSYFDIEAHLRDLLTERVGRILNTYFTTGTGSSQPQGVVTAATLGYTGATGTATSITYEGLVNLIHSLDPAYRMNARFMFNDGSLKAVKLLVDEMGRPLWLPSVSGGTPDTILGYPYTINQDMAAMAAAAKSVLFGDFSKFIVRDVMPFSLVRIAEKYIEAGQVAFLAWSRHDSRCINTAAIKYYANGAAS